MPDQIVAELAKSPLHSVDEARADAPKEPGFYAWWCDVSALSRDLPMVTHEGAERALLYVGVAPSSAQSRSNLRKRLRQHTGGAIGSSTSSHRRNEAADEPVAQRASQVPPRHDGLQERLEEGR